MAASDKAKLNGIDIGANNYTHPTFTEKSSGLYKITVNGQGHVNGTTAVTKADITALGIPASDTTYVNATTTTSGLMSSADKTKLDNFKDANTYATKAEAVGSVTLLPGTGDTLLITKANTTTTETHKITNVDKLTTKRSINGVPFDGTADITNYVECPTAANEPIKNVDLTNFNLVENKPVKGARLLIKFTNMNSASDPKLSINNDTKDDHARPLMLTSSDPMGTDFKTNGWPDGAVIPFTYDGTQWIRDYWHNEILYKTVVQIETDGEKSAKIGDCTCYDYNANRYFLAMILNSNNYKGQLTLNINGTFIENPPPIYINGAITSADNCTLPAGMYIVHYDGKGYHFSTEDKIPGIEVDSLKVGTIGSPTNPVYFEKGKPTACSGLLDKYLPLDAGQDYKLTGPLGFTERSGNYGTAVPSVGFDGQLFFAEESETTYPVFYSDSITLAENATSITIPTKIQNPYNSGNYDMLVYYNGLLLIKNTNYTTSTTNISLTSWTAKNGDTFTFLALLNNTKALSISYDTSNFYTKAEVDAKFSELKKLIQQ